MSLMKVRQVMKWMESHSLGRAKQWLVLGLLAAGSLIGGVIANAERRDSGWFEAIESGINHSQMPTHGHHVCGVGVNSFFGHYTACVALVKGSTNKGVIEYQFSENNAIYGNVDMKPTRVPGLYAVSIVFTTGTGQFRQVYGWANGTMRCASKTLGVQQYTLDVEGFVSIVPNTAMPN
jgi:hypothetical protein